MKAENKTQTHAGGVHKEVHKGRQVLLLWCLGSHENRQPVLEQLCLGQHQTCTLCKVEKVCCCRDSPPVEIRDSLFGAMTHQHDATHTGCSDRPTFLLGWISFGLIMSAFPLLCVHLKGFMCHFCRRGLSIKTVTKDMV